ncbi:hypothetical protein [Sphingosinicella terrae]|uniref:hypothetical protein n=1 Tax=Sphingosinicella terrae TaxID=2172047 RepID=UPI000E0D28B6|nr:hypothetical protein [Sphingosinicella terrae]
MRTAVALASALLAAGCTASDYPPAAGWSRAPDLSAYSAMVLYGGIAREQAMLCGGFSPASVDRHWQDDFGGREAAVEAALVGRHGAAAVERAESEAVATRTVPCPDVPDLRWRVHYARLLRLLEVRTGLRG